MQLHDGKMANESSHCICLSMILIDSVLKKIKTFIQNVFRRM